MKFTIITSIALSMLFFTAIQTFDYNSATVDWFTSETGWDGVRQSPINIDTSKLTKENGDVSITATGTDIESGTILNNGSAYSLQVTTSNANIAYKSNSEETTWNLVQFHFHAPSEHTIDGIQYALCLHNVFGRSGATLSDFMVLGFLWELDNDAPDDPFITSLNLTGVSGTTRSISNVPMADLMSWSNRFNKYNYKGGLTTPPWTEAVEWMVVSGIRKINPTQLALFTTLWAGSSSFANNTGNGNNRIVQDLNRRKVNLIGYKDDNDDWEWVWPVFSVLIVLLVVSTVLAVIMIIFYLNKVKEISSAYSVQYKARKISQNDEDWQPGNTDRKNEDGQLESANIKNEGRQLDSRVI